MIRSPLSNFERRIFIENGGIKMSKNLFKRKYLIMLQGRKSIAVNVKSKENWKPLKFRTFGIRCSFCLLFLQGLVEITIKYSNNIEKY